MKTAIHVGAQKEAIVSARKTILEILKAKVKNETKIKAIEALTKICAVEGTSISNCNFTSK